MPGDDGVEESFTAFVRASGARHLRVAVLLTGDWHAAEDLVQTSLVKLYKAWAGVDSRGIGRGGRGVLHLLGVCGNRQAERERGDECSLFNVCFHLYLLFGYTEAFP